MTDVFEMVRGHNRTNNKKTTNTNVVGGEDKRLCNEQFRRQTLGIPNY
jgi:hypothetical protein